MLSDIPKVARFLSSSKRQINASRPIAITFITILNDTLKYLTKETSEIPALVLNTLELIFGMDCCEFDLKDNPKILFRAHSQDKIDEDWIRELVDMFNNLIHYKQVRNNKTNQQIPLHGSLFSNCSF